MKVALLLFAALMIAQLSSVSQAIQQEVGFATTRQVDELIALGKKQQWIDPYLTLGYADSALATAQSLKYDKGIAAAKNLQGFCYWSFGDNDLAIEAALEALNLSNGKNIPLIKAESYYILARGYMDVGEGEKAMATIRLAEQLASEGSDWVLLSSIYNLRGVILFIDGKIDSARLVYTKAYDLGKDRGIDSINFARILSNIGECYEPEDYDRAMDYYRKALSLADKTGNQIAKASITDVIGHAQLRHGELNLAEENLQSALRLAQKLGLRRVVRHAYAGLVDIRLKQDKGSEAVIYQQRYYAVRDSLLGVSKIRQIVELESKYALQLKEQDIQLLEKEGRIHRLWNSILIAMVILLALAALGIYQLQQYRHRKNREMLNMEIDHWAQQLKATEERYKAALVPATAEPLESQDQKLLKQTIGVVDKYLADPLFGVERMASELNMSRTNLHRKIKAITGFAPSELIRSIRLKKAALMILSQSDTVTQIALQVGFDDYSHFSKSFKKYFGVSPTAYGK